MNTEQEIVVNSVTDFLSKIIESTGKEENRGYNFYFRGESRYFKYRTPNLYLERKLALEGSEYYYRNLINELGKDDYQNSASLVQLFSELQHYEAKTRMLDITSNPLVALYFAVEKDEDEDGYIYLFKEEIGKEKFDSGHTIAIKSALNLIPQNSINRFIFLMETILDFVQDTIRDDERLYKHKSW